MFTESILTTPTCCGKNWRNSMQDHLPTQTQNSNREESLLNKSIDCK